ncbi:MAG: DUF493 domain-containing protein [Proteobacteria bacterium]|nr:DUF493 domain-containing protein [Pseudomonadota bacterium]NBY19031.1 DUF493 domain-containing protein [bacterium]
MSLPPIELLESVHKFPGPYTFKIIASNDQETVSKILEVIKTLLNLEELPKYSSRLSDSGKHVSLTVEPTLEKAQEVHTIYKALLKTPGVLLLL